LRLVAAVGDVVAGGDCPADVGTHRAGVTSEDAHVEVEPVERVDRRTELDDGVARRGDVDRAVPRLLAATRPYRGRLVRAEPEQDQARRECAAAQCRLDAVGFRGRRAARRDLVAADNQLQWATHDLQQVQTEIGADVNCYRAAWQQVEMVRDRLRHHDRGALIDPYGLDRIPHLAAQLDALDIWRHWAWGDSVDVQKLGGAVDILLSRGSLQDDRYRALSYAVQQWVIDAGLRLPVPESVTTTAELTGPELGL
jgi:hypothetical protein